MPPLYQWIVETAHREWLQGATVLTGFFGLGPEGSLLEEHAWSIARDRPVIVEVVDEPARIEALLARVEPVFREGSSRSSAPASCCIGGRAADDLLRGPIGLRLVRYLASASR